MKALRQRLNFVASFMQRARFLRHVCGSVVFSLLFACLLNAEAQTPAESIAAVVRLDTTALEASSTAAPLDVAAGLDAALSVQDIAALPRERFMPFVPKATHAISIDKPLWLRMQVSSTEARASDWLLEMPTVIVDRYEVYQKDAAGQWKMSVAGDRVAHRQWPTNSLRPRFPLLATGSGTQDIYVRVVHQLPAAMQPLILNTAAANERDVAAMLMTGMLAGLMVTLLLICAQMTLSYRDETYLWYAGYLLATMMASMAYSGLGQQFLWPSASKFASDAVVYFVFAAFAFNLLFVSAMFGKWLSKLYRWATFALIAALLAFMVQTYFTEEYASSIMVLIGICFVVCAFILFSGLQAWRKRVPYSGYWLLVYIPYLLSIALVIADSSGQLSIPWLPVDTPMLTSMIEAVAMMFCLNAYSRESHAQAVREQAAAQRDPLTGFLNERRFMELANSSWRRASRSGRDISLVYVQVESKGQELNTVQAEAMMMRSVRMVRTTIRESDGLGRIGRNVLGIAMPDTRPGDALNASLSRLVALGLMLDPQDGTAQVLKFTLAVGSWRANPEEFSLIDKQLRTLLAKGTEDRARTIRFLEPEL